MIKLIASADVQYLICCPNFCYSATQNGQRTVVAEPLQERKASTAPASPQVHVTIEVIEETALHY